MPDRDPMAILAHETARNAAGVVPWDAEHETRVQEAEAAAAGARRRYYAAHGLDPRYPIDAQPDARAVPALFDVCAEALDPDPPAPPAMSLRDALAEAARLTNARRRGPR